MKKEVFEAAEAHRAILEAHDLEDIQGWRLERDKKVERRLHSVTILLKAREIRKERDSRAPVE
jgi:hypothetical protein